MKKHPKYTWLSISEDGLIVLNNKFNREMKGSIDRGYTRIGIHNKLLGLKLQQGVHRLVAETFIPNPENKPEVHHRDRNPSNNHYTNLQWVTKKEHDDIHLEERRVFQSERMIGNKNGYTSFLGKKHSKKTKEHLSKVRSGNIYGNFTPYETTIKIHKDYNSGKYTTIELGKKYGVHSTTIGNIGRKSIESFNNRKKPKK